MQTLRPGGWLAEFALGEFVVVEVLIRQAKIGGGGLLRIFGPASVLVGTATRTGLGVARNFRTTIGTGFGRRHGTMMKEELRMKKQASFTHPAAASFCLFHSSFENLPGGAGVFLVGFQIEAHQ